MGRHSKKEDLNNKPFNSNATPEQKGKEFDDQYGQNQGNAKSFIERPKGRHAK